MAACAALGAPADTAAPGAAQASSPPQAPPRQGAQPHEAQQAAALSAGAGPPPATSQVHIVVGPQSHELVRLAAHELASQLERLYRTEVQIADAIPADTRALVLVGSPQDNPAIAAAMEGRWPQLSQQGLLLRSIPEPPALVVGGGSPRATLWAVYELGRRLGITYLLSGDVDPAPPAEPFSTTGYDVLLEPQFPHRVLALLGDQVIGPSCWDLNENARVLGQLAKLKYNGVVLVMHPWQPFVHFSVSGISKSQARLWRQTHWPVGGDTAGRAAFGGARSFVNPDLAGKNSYPMLTDAGIELARGIMARARQLGMSCAVLFAPLEVPQDFSSLLPESASPAGAEGLSLIPHPTRAKEIEPWSAAVSAQWQAYLQTYPDLEALYLSLPQEPVWTEGAPDAWQELTGRTRDELQQLIDTLPEGERASVQGPLLLGHVSSLAFLRRAMAALSPPSRGMPRLYLKGLHPALYPAAEELLPPGAGVVASGEHVAEEGEASTLARLPKSRHGVVWLMLGEAGQGTFFTSEGVKLRDRLLAAQQAGHDGFVLECAVAADHDFTLHLLSRASFEPDLKVEEALGSLIDPLCGQGVAERVALALERIERAGALIARHDPQWGRPAPQMVLRHAVAEPAPTWWEEAAALYTEGANDLYRAADRSRVEGRPYLRRLIRRCEWGWYYFQSVAALRAAEQANDLDSRLSQLEAAVEHMYNGLAALAEAAHDNSSRAVIAVLNEYGYRPLAARLEEAGR
ncbi:MAG: hypothetical protein K6T86_21135 [Pirellulales bacterium]|nr:hypothetical protein [Pirellulales bacterium]